MCLHVRICVFVCLSVVSLLVVPRHVTLCVGLMFNMKVYAHVYLYASRTYTEALIRTMHSTYTSGSQKKNGETYAQAYM
jgi:hypothetical protein